jgi:hypothetical protein
MNFHIIKHAVNGLFILFIYDFKVVNEYHVNENIYV